MLLDKLNQCRISDPMIQFLFDFEAYFDQVCRDIDLKRISSAQLQQIKEVMFVA